MNVLRCSSLRLSLVVSVLAVPGIANPASGPVTPVIAGVGQLFPPNTVRLPEGLSLAVLRRESPTEELTADPLT